MPGNNFAIAGDALIGAVRSEFLSTYQSEYVGVENNLKDMCKLSVPSNKVMERYVYFESAAHPKRQDRDEEVSFGEFKSKSFVVANHRFSKAVNLHQDDQADDQTAGGLLGRARDFGTNFALVPERLAYQVLLSQTDNNLLPAVPNAPDGVAMFSATDGTGAARWGFTGGNIVTGTGVATAAAIRANFWSALAAFGGFKDSSPDAQPLIHPSKLTKFVIYFNVANIEVFREAFHGVITYRTMTSPGNLAVSQSNSILEAGVQVILVPTQRITDNDWYVRCASINHYSLFEQSRSPINEFAGNNTNSDRSRMTGYDYMGWWVRTGFGLGLPYDWVKVNN